MRLFAFVLVACGLMFPSATFASMAHDGSPLSCDGKPADFHAERALRIVRKAHDRLRVLDPSPAKQAEKRAWRGHTLCLLDGDRRERVRERIDKIQSKFDAYFIRLITPPGRAWLDALGACEADTSGGYSANTGNGYAGRYQFSQSTWNSTADDFERLTGLDANYSRLAAPREQDIRAALLQRREGSGHWPNCAPW